MKETPLRSPGGEIPPTDDALTRADSPAAMLDTDDAKATLAALEPAPVSRSSVDASGPSLAASVASASLSSAVETLHVQEVARTRTFFQLSCALAAVVIPVVLALGGDAVVKRVFLGSLVLVIVATGIYSIALRREEAYSLARTLAVGILSIGCAFAGIFFFGVYSAATTALPFGLYFFSASQSRRSTVGVYAGCAILYLALSVMIMAGITDDRGIVSGASMTNLERLIVTFLLEAVLLLTFLNARATRSSALSSIQRHDVVVRRLAQREALLQEAKQELERALDFAGLGRFSETVIGSFRLGKVIGRGAMGEVYEGVHVKSGARAAVKLLHTHTLANPDIVKRFLREAKIVGSLDVPNVVKVVEIGGLSADLPYIAMELLDGEDLADHLRHHRQLSVRKVATLLRQVGNGLSAAHAAGIVHRDLKPRNVFLAKTDAGQIWKILDFGVSKLTGDDGTQTHDRIVGTPGYMAPEQATGKLVTYKADLFSLGVIAYRSLTGRPAFTGNQIAETVYQVAHTMPPRPSDVVKLGEQVDQVLAIAIAKAPEDRFDTAEAFADALDAAARGELDVALRARAERLLARHPWAT